MKPFQHAKDDVGNRRRTHEAHYPPDDIGNRAESLMRIYHVPEAIGNVIGGNLQRPQQAQRRPLPARPMPPPRQQRVERPAPLPAPEPEERPVYTLKSEPEEKRVLAESTVRTILGFVFEQGSAVAELTTEDEQPCVIVKVQEPADAKASLVKNGSAALGAFNFLVNKIVNRYPDDRIRLVVQ